MSKTVEDVRATLSGTPRRRWLPWRRKTLGEQVSDVADQMSDTASDIAEGVGKKASHLAGRVGLRKRTPTERARVAVSDVAGLVGQTTGEIAGRAGEGALNVVDRAALVATPGRRTFWQRKTLGERAVETVGQTGETASVLAGQIGETTSGLASRATGRTGHLAKRAAGKATERFSGGQLADAEEMTGYEPAAPARWYRPFSSVADLSAERAAVAAEAASDAAQRAVGLMERMGSVLRLQASRAALPSEPAALPVSQPSARAAVAGRGMLPETLLAEGEEQAGTGRKVTSSLKRTVTRVGERINELSDGRYGLEPEQPKEEKKSTKRRQQQKLKAKKETEKSSRVSGLAWTIGLTLGLVIGLMGVAYWQRRRLQRLWGETSQRMQQATEELRQRFDAQRKASPQMAEWDFPPEMKQAGQAGTSPEAPFTQFGSSAPHTELGQQTNGRVESGTQ